MKNWLLKRLVSLLRPPFHPIRNRVLIVSTTALGDTLWATPAIKAIKPQTQYLAVLTSPLGAEVLRNNPFVDRIFILKRLNALRKTLIKEQIDTVLIFHTSQRIALPLVSCIGARRIVGSTGMNKGLDELLTDQVNANYEHEIVRRLKIAQTVGINIPEDQTLSFYLDPFEKWPLLNGINICIHPGSQDSYKRWPLNNFVDLAEQLKQKIPGVSLWITGSKKEQELVQEIARQIPGAIADSPRPLRSFAALLDRMDVVISNDTGPTHLAWALGRAAISLYSPTDPNLCGPHHAAKGSKIAYPPTCYPCVKRKCRSPFCLLQIGVKEVVEKVIETL